ncbi:MAG: hypothetical protein R6W97_08075 [Thiobacillus sp.]
MAVFTHRISPLENVWHYAEACEAILAHKVAITLEACHAREVIDAAFARYGTPEIVNTDQGGQFTAETFTEAVLAQGF